MATLRTHEVEATMTPSDRQQAINVANSAFWDEMCGSLAARALGITGNDRVSLKRYDDWFLGYYPYLYNYIDFASLRGRDVLEVGLGYGTVGQKIAEAGARYTGLDIAKGPVDGLNHRLAQSGLPGSAMLGSILDPPFENESFDVVVAIGCYHHTGDLPLALANTAKLLRPNGHALVMIYNAANYVRMMVDPLRTIRHLARGDVESAHEGVRARFDQNTQGDTAPETALVSRGTFRRLLLKNFRTANVSIENAVPHWPLHFLSRGVMCATLGKIAGLDLYAVVTK
jgi:SAM-dependent methyltransferase